MQKAEFSIKKLNTLFSLVVFQLKEYLMILINSVAKDNISFLMGIIGIPIHKYLLYLYKLLQSRF